mmetsp:Transcript_21751/g.67911  ORF Transcript_21751/g.67911 Transcript_21751/m.67911 type:complete len:136 (+) Transcript_21751:68-475(+)
MVANVVHSLAVGPRSTISRILWAVELSRPLEGSSRSRICGLVTTSMPMDTRFRWPPERPLLTSWSDTSPRPSPRMTLSTSSRRSRRSPSSGAASLPDDCGSHGSACPVSLVRRSAWKAMFSRTERRVCMTSSCGT